MRDVDDEKVNVVVDGAAPHWPDVACSVGEATARKFDKQLGDSFPIIGALFPRLDGQPWDFRIAGIYRSKKKTIDDNTLFFHADYLEKALDAHEATGPHGVGLYVLRTKPGADQLCDEIRTCVPAPMVPDLVGDTTSMNWFPTGSTALCKPNVATPGSRNATSMPSASPSARTTASRSCATSATCRSRIQLM